jgi:Sap, sulfolipid-1-addressing protein
VSHALVYSVGVALSPVAIASSILLLSCPGGTAKAATFALGWLAGLAAMETLLAVLVDRADLSDADPLWIGVPELALGVAFFAASATVWLRRRRRSEQPAWLAAIDRLTPIGSGGLGIVAAGANPKIVALALGAALALAEAGASTSETVVALGLFAAIGTLGVALPLAIHAAARERSEHVFGAMRSWLARHDRAVLALVGLVLGAVFVLDALSAF